MVKGGIWCLCYRMLQLIISTDHETNLMPFFIVVTSLATKKIQLQSHLQLKLQLNLQLKCTNQDANPTLQESSEH
jgi:hypothetical protein